LLPGTTPEAGGLSRSVLDRVGLTVRAALGDVSPRVEGLKEIPFACEATPSTGKSPGMHRRTMCVALAAVLTALVAGTMVEIAVAKMPNRPGMKALVDGKRFKGLKTATTILYATTTFSVNSQTKVKRGVSRFISVGCGPGVDLLALPIPSPTILCYGTYQTNSVRGGDQKTWLGATPTMELVIETFDGTRASGTFLGAISAAVGTVEPPVTIESGRFTAPIQNPGG